MKKIFSFFIFLLLVVPFISVNAMADTTFIVNSLSDSLKDVNGNLSYENNQIQISWPVWLSADESIYEISYDENIIEYDPEIPTNYNEASYVSNLDFMILSDILPGVLKANGYTDEQIRIFLTGEYEPTFEVNGIEICSKGGELEFSSDDSTIEITPLKIRIDVTKANINTTGEPEVKTTTVEDIVNLLSSDKSFTEFKYDGVVYSTNSIEKDDKKIIVTHNDNYYDWKYVYLDCEDDVISYEVDEIADYSDASSVLSHLMFAEMIKNMALKENGYTSEQILDFENNNLYNYNINGIEIKELGESKEYVNDSDKITISPVSIKINLAKANLKTEVDLEEYTISSNTNSGDLISFSALEGDSYSFYIKDRKDTTDEELQQILELMDDSEYTFESLKEQLNKFIGYGNEAAGTGTLLKLYEIYLYNNGLEVHEVDGGFNIKLKLTDDMKGYDSYKLVYIADDGTIEDTIQLSINGDYLEGTLPHLSMYALVGNKTNSSNDITSNPQTGDNVMLYITMLGLSVFGLAGSIVYIKKVN